MPTMSGMLIGSTRHSESAIDTTQLCYRLGRVLPRDISCEKIEAVSADMHARFSARRRVYRYFIHTKRDPFLRHYSVEMHYPLDFDLMNQAAAQLLTVDDFKAFCKAGADVKTTLCDVTTAQWVKTGESSYYFAPFPSCAPCSGRSCRRFHTPPRRIPLHCRVSKGEFCERRSGNLMHGLKDQ